MSDAPWEIESGFERDDFELVPDSSEAARSRTSELNALGFERLGVSWERGRPSPGAEVHLTQSVCFANAPAEAFASYFFNQEGVPRLYFFTPFRTGEYVLTSTYPRLHEKRTKRAILSGTERLPLVEVLEIHKKGIAEFKKAGLLPFASWSKRDRLASIDLYYRNPDSMLHLMERHNFTVFLEVLSYLVTPICVLVWLLNDKPAPLARAIAATSTCAMLALSCYSSFAYFDRLKPWYWRYPVIAVPLGLLALAWLIRG